MNPFLAALKDNHGHSHGAGDSCSGHSHGSHEVDSGSEHFKEEREVMLKYMEDRMRMIKAAEGSLSIPGKVLYDPNDPGPGTYSKLLFGSGHEGSAPPMGWGSLAPSEPNDEIMKHMDAVGVMDRNRYWSFSAPIIGRMRIVKDSNGILLALGVVLYWLYGNWSTWTAVLLPYYYDGAISLPLVLLYATVSVLCITSFIRASTLNPGSLNVDELPQENWTECKVCMTLRPPKSHHCRRCGQCVRRMDHHCPWINNCVGEDNQFVFMLLLLYAFLLSVVTLIIFFNYFFLLDDCVTCQKDSFVIRYQNTIVYTCLFLAVLMFSFSLSLLCQLHMGVILDTPTLERMKIERDIHTTGVIPDTLFLHNKSACELYFDLCGKTPLWCMLLPCRRRQSRNSSD